MTAAIDAQRGAFESLGCVVEDAEPDFTDTDAIFKVWRHYARAMGQTQLLAEHRDRMKDTVIWDIEQGQKQTGPEVGWADTKRAELFQRVHDFMETYEFLVCPVSQVPPFDVKQRYVTEINGVQMETYIDWMKSCYYITATAHPAISVPCGFTPEGLPVGVQIVGRYRDDFGVLQLAHAFEQATGAWQRRPGVAQ